jgi:hypothetical protein
MAIIATIRKFISVFLSVILYGNPLLNRQWCAAGIIFGALFLDIFFSKKPKKKVEAETQEKSQGREPVENIRKIEIFVLDSSDPNNNAKLT